MFEDFDDIFKNFEKLFGKKPGVIRVINLSNNLNNFDPVKFMGGEYTKTEERGEDENGKFTIETYKSKDGNKTYTRKVIEGMTPERMAPFHSKKEITLSELQDQLKKAVESENFEKASQLRDEIAALKTKTQTT